MLKTGLLEPHRPDPFTPQTGHESLLTSDTSLELSSTPYLLGKAIAVTMTTTFTLVSTVNVLLENLTGQESSRLAQSPLFCLVSLFMLVLGPLEHFATIEWHSFTLEFSLPSYTWRIAPT